MGNSDAAIIVKATLSTVKVRESHVEGVWQGTFVSNHYMVTEVNEQGRTSRPPSEAQLRYVSEVSKPSPLCFEVNKPPELRSTGGRGVRSYVNS